MPTPIIPPALKPGATIAFISPSARLNDELPLVMRRATSVLESLGYKVRTYFNPDAGIQSSISNRLAEIRAALNAPDVSAVICTIGGPAFTELIPALVADTDLHAAVRANPKIVVGYSDISGLHWLLHATTGLRTFYGPGAIPELGEASSLSDESSPLAFCVKHLFRAIADSRPLGDIARSPTYAKDAAPMFTDPSSLAAPVLTPAHPWRWLRPGKAQGRLFGGCLTVVARLQGVRSIAPDWRGRIIFLETALGDDEVSGNPISRVQAGFADLIAGGAFDEAAGLVVGRPFGYDTPEAQDQYAGVITGLLTEGHLAEKKFPILFNVDIGHTTPMVTLPFDALAELDSDADRFAVLEAGVV
ncbi:peptidase u61 ld-carboxypeptidase a [Plectosphaerella cucumerina]|uniref:Peptidase u61 ld-carboxypeptidase a n=1 Tax=Plectosphaerella cucumerina TaxID=40658 RepID=A0A8K0X7D3_9PEZI|nr:peptidase u61 ld-carboxypeptidase a [Plectosphaerella cucumerina]